MTRESFSLSRWIGIILKEFIQLKRDRLTFGMIIGIPVIQLLLFGFAINTDTKHLPTAVLSTGLMLVAVMSFVCGLVLDTVTRGRRELKRMHYLTHSGVPMRGRRATDRVLENQRP